MKQTKYIVVIMLIITSVTFIQCSSSNKEEIHRQLQIEIDGLNQNTPVRITQNMQFDSCALHSNNNLEYFFSITDSITPNANFFKKLEGDVRDITKTDPSLNDIRKNKLSIKYNYRDRNGKQVHSFTIKPEDYQ